ncbi:MAG: hypothetical protein JWL65_4267 [Gammaproteobacteria bacterium]|nr:hypothetical protein [Gammaproteobacteria bacterium]
MWLDWLSSRIASDVGNSLADHFMAATAATKGRPPSRSAEQGNAIQSLLARVDSEARPLRLGMFRRAKLANSFKWRLLDAGTDPALVGELTRMLLL